MKIGVMLPNWIGDVAMATPALRALRQYYRNGTKIIGIMRPYVADVLAGTSWLDEPLFYTRRGRGSMQSISQLICQLRRRRLDQLLLLTNSLSTALISRFSGARERIGFARYGRSWMLTTRLTPPRAGGKRVPISAVDYYLRVVTASGCPTTSRRLQLATVPEDQNLADRVFERLRISPGDPVVAMNTGGAYGAAKHWPLKHGAELARTMAAQLDCHVLVLCGPAEQEAAERLVSMADERRVTSLAGQPLSIGLSKACIDRSRLLVTTDSGPRHLAAGLGVPTVTLFGSTDPRWSRNYHEPAVELRYELPCAPCAKRRCPLEHHQCMEQLTPEAVFREVRQLWELPKAQPDEPSSAA